MNQLTPIGTLSVFEQPGSPTITVNADGNTATRVFRGPYTDITAAVPTVNSQFEDLPGYYVHNAELIRQQQTGLGLLTITLRSTPATRAATENPTPEYELDWLDQDVDIKRHPIFQPGGDRELSSDDWQALDLWEKGELTLSLNDLGEAAYYLASNYIALGKTSYRLSVPVIRATTYHLIQPTASTVPVRETPPTTLGVTGWQWLKTADRIRKTKTNYTRYQEWTGAIEWPAEIYP